MDAGGRRKVNDRCNNRQLCAQLYLRRCVYDGKEGRQMSNYISKETAEELLLQPITMSICLTREECLAKRSQRDIDIALIHSIPAADMRPVVLCKDCIYAPSGTDDGEDRGFALEWPHDEWPEYNLCPYKCDDGWYSHKPKPSFFCANGKVKNNG